MTNENNTCYVTLSDGVRLSYQIHGPADAPWLILLNGLLADANIWSGSLLGLKSSYRILTFDSRGQGKSDAPLDQPYTAQLLAKDAWELLTILNIKRPLLAGTSNGGAIGLELLVAHPGVFCGAVLANTVAYIDFSMSVCLRHWLSCLKLGGLEMQFDAAAPYIWSNRFLQQRYEKLKYNYLQLNSLHNSYDNLCYQIDGVLDWDIRSRLSKVQDPVLFLIGAEDLLTPAWKCLELHSLISSSKFDIIPEASHAFVAESPKDFIVRLHSFYKACIRQGRC